MFSDLLILIAYLLKGLKWPRLLCEIAVFLESFFNLVGTYRRQYGEDLESFSTGKTRTNWLSIDNETHRLRAAVRDQVVKLLAPAVLRHLDLPSNHHWTRQVPTLKLCTCV